MDPDPGGGSGGGGGGGVNKGNSDTGKAKEKDAVPSFVSCFSEKETKEPWPPPLLPVGDIMMDCTNT